MIIYALKNNNFHKDKFNKITVYEYNTASVHCLNILIGICVCESGEAVGDVFNKCYSISTLML